MTSGERATATYVTPQSTRKWMYSDYEPVGEPTDPKRVFQTLTLVDNTSGAPTTEEFHYAYDTAGRLREAAFAQSPDAIFSLPHYPVCALKPLPETNITSQC